MRCTSVEIFLELTDSSPFATWSEDQFKEIKKQPEEKLAVGFEDAQDQGWQSPPHADLVCAERYGYELRRGPGQAV
jgi:hypothetical protein